MMGAVRRVSVVVLVITICATAWAGKLTVRVSHAMTPVGGANVTVEPAGVAGTTNPAGKWDDTVPAGDQRVICWSEIGGVLKGGIVDITMPAGNHDVDVALVDAIWIQQYFPLAVGNAWQYEYRHSETGGATSRSTWRERVDRTEAIGGATASVILATKDGVPEWEEIRGSTSAGFVMYTQQHGADTIKFDPPLSIGPLMPMGYEWVVRGVGHHSDGSADTRMLFRCKFDAFQDMRVPAGNFPDCARLIVAFEAGQEKNDVTVWAARNVGIVREIEKNPERTNVKLLEEYTIRGLPMRPIRPIGPLTPRLP
jgi:hypothetical protein